jgi:hypothetical protein
MPTRPSQLILDNIHKVPSSSLFQTVFFASAILLKTHLLSVFVIMSNKPEYQYSANDPRPATIKIEDGGSLTIGVVVREESEGNAIKIGACGIYRGTAGHTNISIKESICSEKVDIKVHSAVEYLFLHAVRNNMHCGQSGTLIQR